MTGYTGHTFPAFDESLFHPRRPHKSTASLFLTLKLRYSSRAIVDLLSSHPLYATVKFIKEIPADSSHCTLRHTFVLTNPPAGLPDSLPSFHFITCCRHLSLKNFCPVCQTDDRRAIASSRQFHTTSAHSMRMTLCLRSRRDHPS